MVLTMAESAFQKFYPKLLKVLPISSILSDFYSRGLLPGDHKANIDALDTQKRKAEYFLDSVIKPGLEVGYMGQFDEMIKVMESSDDPAVKFVAGEIRGSESSLDSRCQDSRTTGGCLGCTKLMVHYLREQ